MTAISGLKQFVAASSEKLSCWLSQHPTVKKVIQIALPILGACLIAATPFLGPWGIATFVVAASLLFLASIAIYYLSRSINIDPNNPKIPVLKPASCEWGDLYFYNNIPTLSVDSLDPLLIGKAQGYLFGGAIQVIRNQLDFDRHSQESSQFIEGSKKSLPKEHITEMEGIVEGYNKWASEQSAPDSKPMTLDELIHLLSQPKAKDQNFPLCIECRKSPIEGKSRSRFGEIIKTAAIGGALLAGLAINPLWTATAYASLPIVKEFIKEGYVRGYQHRYFRSELIFPTRQELLQIFENQIKTHPHYELFKKLSGKNTDKEFYQYFVKDIEKGCCHGYTETLLREAVHDPDAFKKVNALKMDAIVMSQFNYSMAFELHLENKKRFSKLNELCERSSEWQRKLAQLNLLKDRLTPEAFEKERRKQKIEWLDSKEPLAEEYNKEMRIWCKNEEIREKLESAIPAKKECIVFIPEEAEDFRKAFLQLGISKEQKTYGRSLGYIEIPGHIFAFEWTPNKYRIYDQNAPGGHLTPFGFGKRGLYEFDTEDEFFHALTKHSSKVEIRFSLLGGLAEPVPQKVLIGICPVRSTTAPLLETPIAKVIFEAPREVAAGA